MPLPGIENDGAKRFDHLSLITCHSSLVIRSAGGVKHRVKGRGYKVKRIGLMDIFPLPHSAFRIPISALCFIIPNSVFPLPNSNICHLTFQTESNEILYFFIFLYKSVRWMPSILAALALLLPVSLKAKRMASFSAMACTSLMEV